jgi:eukaryotic-like serine/threonine-protein kinase
MLGELLDRRYQINQTLASGGFGQTFLAEDTKLPGSPICVVKQLKPFSNDPNTLQIARRLFADEAQVLQRVGNHDQIPRLLAYFEENQEFFLVQEFIDGHPLSQEITPGKALSEVEVVNLLQDVLEPLAFVHQSQIIHRDIKPANLIRRDRDRKIVLIDFGAVKEIAVTQVNSQGESLLTVGIGTPGYMPSEQTRGIPRLSSDIYAVGMMGIQALTGLMPQELREDPQTAEILWRHHVQVSSPLADILDNMVRYDFRQRYQSAKEALHALQQLQQEQFIPVTIITAAINPSLHELTLEWVEAGQQRNQIILENQPTKNPGTFRIGRDPATCDLVLTEPTISRLQAEIFFNSQYKCFYLRSLNQNNPPVVNGQALPTGEVLLNQGSSLRLGQMEFRVAAIALKQHPVGYVPPQPSFPGNNPPQQPPISTQKPLQESNPPQPQYAPPPVQPQYKQEISTPQRQPQSPVAPTQAKVSQVGWGFWLKWVLINLAGFVVGLLVLGSLYVSYNPLPSYVAWGLVIGIFQWFTLRGVVKRPWLWGLVTAMISMTLFGWFIVLPTNGILLFRQLRRANSQN